MKRLLAIFLMPVACSLVFAQEIPKIAVLIGGDKDDKLKKVFENKLLDEITQKYQYERADIEQKNADFLLSVEILDVLDASAVSANLIDVKTSAPIKTANTDSPLKTMQDLTDLTLQITVKIFGNTASIQTNIQAVESVPNGSQPQNVTEPPQQQQGSCSKALTDFIKQDFARKLNDCGKELGKEIALSKVPFSKKAAPNPKTFIPQCTLKDIKGKMPQATVAFRDVESFVNTLLIAGSDPATIAKSVTSMNVTGLVNKIQNMAVPGDCEGSAVQKNGREAIRSSSNLGSCIDADITIGSQTWKKCNLNVNASGSKCYDDDQNNCEKYGRLYDWATAMNLPSSCNNYNCASRIKTPHQGLCPSGYHVPTDRDWNILVNYVAGNAGKKLKATNGWNNNGNGTDDYGFSALPGGKRNSDGYFYYLDYNGYWWSTSELRGYNAYYRADYHYISNSTENTNRSSNDKSNGFSVRCVRD